MNKINYNKRSLLFGVISILNIGLAALLFMGANFLATKGTDNFIAMKDIAKEKGISLAENLYTKFKTSDEVRKDPPEILSQQNLYDVTKYDLSLWFDIPAKTIKGEMIMEAYSLSDTLNQVYLNRYENRKVNSVSFLENPDAKDTSADLRKISGWTDASFKQDNNYLTVNPSVKIPSGETFLVKVSYSGSPKKLGFDSFSFKEFYGNMAIYTLSEPNYGPVWWPSKDLPSDKSFTELHIHTPPGMKAASNGMLTDVSIEEDSLMTYNWKSTYPIATYLVSIVVTKFAYWEDSYTSLDGTKQMPLTYYVFPRDSAKSRIDWKKTPEMIKMLATDFGEYPFINEKYGMAQFGWTSGAMEHQTLTSYGYLLLTGDNAYDNVVIHELSHQWFGDAVTLMNWKNIWLNEGFASYCEALWEEHISGKQAYFDYLKGFDYGYFSGTVYAPAGFIDSPPVYATVYQKGAWVLHMLRGVLGDETFFKGMREYFERFKYKNAETSDFMGVMEEVSGKKLDWFFDEWVYKGTGRPKYEYSWKFEDFQGTNSGNYTVRLQLKQVQEDDVYKMPVKINIVTDDTIQDFTIFNDSRSQDFQFVVNSKPKEVQIDREGWILKKIAKGKY
jgi:aminopeptidase N